LNARSTKSALNTEARVSSQLARVKMAMWSLDTTKEATRTTQSWFNRQKMSTSFQKTLNLWLLLLKILLEQTSRICSLLIE
jgi:hypothetical protein